MPFRGHGVFMSTLLYDTIKAAALLSDRVAVSYSGGKDSAVVLDLCVRFFKHVEVVHFYVVPGLSFMEAMWSWVERQYGLDVWLFPHFALSNYMRWGLYRMADFSVPIISPGDLYRRVREVTGCYWIAGGETLRDSLMRRGMINNFGTISAKRGRIFPIAHWKKSDIFTYVQRKRLKIAPESGILGCSFGELDPFSLYQIKKFYPQDFEIIRDWFPFADVAVLHYELFAGLGKQRKGDVRVAAN